MIRAVGVSSRVIAAGVTLVVAQLVLIASLSRWPQQGWMLLAALGVGAGLAWWVRRDVDRLPLWFIGVVAAAVQLPGLFTDPLTSDDAFRYVWDARVQLAGIDPYRYPPLDPALAGLRVPELFPPGQPPLINRPTVPTIYPPLAQVWFLMIGVVTPLRLGTLGVQVGAAAAVVATTLLLARLLDRSPGGHRGRSLLYGACPLVALEAGNGGHLDAVTALAMIGFAWAVSQDRLRAAGLAWGAAVGLKLVPIVLLPVLLRRGRWPIAVVGAALVALAYLPHLLAVGGRVVGYLPGYWQEEGYEAGSRFALFILLPEPARTPAALLVAGVIAVLALRRSGDEPVLTTACWLYGCSFLVATPTYPWYVLPLAVLAIAARRLEWLAVLPAAYLAFAFYQSTAIRALAYAAVVLVVVLASRVRAAGREAAVGRAEGRTVSRS